MCTYGYGLARACTVARSVAAIAMVLCATTAFAQSEARADATDVPDRPSKLRLLLTTQAILHAGDMVTTVYDLRVGADTREGNPLLAPLSGRPEALVAVSTAVNVLQIYTITRLHRRHPKLAVAWALILVGTEAYAVANNVRIAGQLQGGRAGAP
jgi:hypothetical protein